MTAEVTNATGAQRASNNGGAKVAKTEKNAELVAFLSSDRAPFISGVDEVIEGGTMPTV